MFRVGDLQGNRWIINSFNNHTWSHQTLGCGGAHALGAGSPETPLTVGTKAEMRRGSGRDSRRAGESLDYLPAHELLSCAVELQKFTLLGISDEASKALLRGY